MLDGKQISKKLIGSEGERAVSPVIGVILMVAITVILAAVIAAFVLDLGGSVGEEAQAGVSIDVDESDKGNVTVEVTSLGNADHVNLSGAVNDEGVADSGEQLDELEMGVGDTVRLNYHDEDNEGGLSSDSGTVTAVAIIEEDDTQTTVASEDFDGFEEHNPE